MRDGRRVRNFILFSHLIVTLLSLFSHSPSPDYVGSSLSEGAFSQKHSSLSFCLLLLIGIDSFEPRNYVAFALQKPRLTFQVNLGRLLYRMLSKYFLSLSASPSKR